MDNIYDANFKFSYDFCSFVLVIKSLQSMLLFWLEYKIIIFFD